MSNTQVFFLILIGVGGGITYGRWRSERIRAARAAHLAWKARHDYKKKEKEDDLGNFRKWRRLY